MKNKIMNAIVLIELFIIIGLTIYIFVDVKTDKKEKNFSLKTNEIVLEVNEEYNLLDYIELKNIKLSDLNIIYDEEYVLIKNNKLLVKNDINETKIKLSYKDVEYELVINVDNISEQCRYQYEEINLLNSSNNIGFNPFSLKCNNFVVNYNDMNVYFFKNSDLFDIRIYVNDKLVLDIDKKNIANFKIEKLSEVYLVNIAYDIYQCGETNLILLVDKNGNILKNTSYELEKDEINEYGEGFYRRIEFKNDKIVEEFYRCGTFVGENPNHQRIYEYKNGLLVLVEKK